MTAYTALSEKCMDGTYEYELEGTYTISDSHAEILYKMALLDCYRDRHIYENFLAYSIFILCCMIAIFCAPQGIEKNH